jgi:cysteine desulfurase NifS
LRADGEPGFDTPTKKFEIWSTKLEEYGYEPLPKYTEPVEGPRANQELAQDFPLVFNSGARPHTDFRSQDHGIDGLVRENPEPTMDIHRKDAAERGIETGDLVEVRTPRGSVPFRTRVTEDIAPGAIECGMGGGTPVGPKAWQEWNVNELTDLGNYDEISGFPVYKALLCEVTKIETGNEATRSSVKNRSPELSLPVIGTPWTRPEPKKRVYLDNNATTPVAEAVREAMLPYLGSFHGNPSSIYSDGRDAKSALEKARRQVAKLVNARPRRIVFTGGGSESDNLALKGVAFALRNGGRHIITTKVEHPAILGTCAFLEKLGYTITYLDVDRDGWLSPEELERALTDDTLLVSIKMANNETGTVLPIKELCQVAHERNILFHTDAIQAVGKIKADVEELGVDLLSISGHKFHAPKGIGALYMRQGVELEPLVHGGKQEGGIRAGTENVASIVGLGQAAELAMHALRDSEKTKTLRDRLQDGILELIPEAHINGHSENRLPNTLSVTLPDIRGESLVVAMDQHGISLASGSACKTGSPKPTHVLIAMGRTERQAHCTIRLSLSRETTQENIEQTLAALKLVLEEMETTVRFLPCK